MKHRNTWKGFWLLALCLAMCLSFSWGVMAEENESDVVYSYSAGDVFEQPASEEDVAYFDYAETSKTPLTTAKTLINSLKVYPQETGYESIDAKVDAILAPYANSDTYTKLKAAYDWLVRNVDFTWSAYNEQNWYGFAKPYHYNDFVGKYACPIPNSVIDRGYYAMFYGEGVCYNYASAFAIMARNIGINAYVHTGTFVWSPTYSTVHAWVEIPINGTMYIFDPQQEYRASNDGNGTIPYKYFCLSHSDDSRFNWNTKENADRDASFIPVTSHGKQVRADITVSASENGTVQGGARYDIDSTCTVTAQPKNGVSFRGWYEGDNLVSTDASYRFTVTRDRNLVAMFGDDLFYDVASTQWFYPYIVGCHELELMKGIDAVTFAPDNSMTRGMMVTVLARMAQADLTDYEKDSAFQDVSKEQWFCSAINWAYEKGITIGISETEFGPDLKMTREQMATFIDRYFDVMGLELPKFKEPQTFGDSSAIGDWAKESVDAVQQAGIVEGYPNGNFGPGNALTRAEAATMMFRCYGEVKVTIEGEGTVAGEGLYLWGDEVTLTATPDEGSTFLSWDQGMESLSTDNPYTFVLKEKMDDLTCRFEVAAE